MAAVVDGIVRNLEEVQVVVRSCQEEAVPVAEGSAAERMVEAAPAEGRSARQAVADLAEVCTLCYTRLPLC